MGGEESPATLAGELTRRRRRAFVGRDSARELFAAALDADAPPFSVVFVHGPGGIGKSALLDAFADLAASAGAREVRVDGRGVVPSPEAFLDAVGSDLDVPPGEGPITSPSEPVVLLVDGYEHLVPLDDWLRTCLLPRLPASTLTVIAGRIRPPVAWRGDAAWRDLLRIVGLRNLSPDESSEYLAANGVDPAWHDRLIAATHGHPLALSLVTDLVVRGDEPPLDPLTPDLVGTLVRRFVGTVPTARHRRALEVCALARTTTEALLRDALEVDDAHELFGWLRDLSFVETGPGGLVPHDLARDVLDVDLRWRDPDAYRQVFRRVRAHVHRRLRTLSGIEQQRAIFDEKFVFRNLPSVLSPVDWKAWGDHHPEPATAADRDEIIAIVREAEGDASAAIAEQWWERQPEAFFVVRGRDGAVRGVLGLVTLRNGPDELAFDPGAVAAWQFAQRTAPPRRGDRITQTRFVVDRERYQGPSPTLNATPVLTMQRYLHMPDLSWDFLTLAEPDPLDDYFAIADLPRAVGADFEVGGRRYGLFAHDFRRTPVDTWLEVVTERALAQEIPLPPQPADELLVLAEAAFADAARRALRDLPRRDLLERNPLCRTRLVADRADAGRRDGDVLYDLVVEAIEALRAHPRDDKRWRALRRTYVDGAPTQERAAEVLGLPFSTYRRHLAEGVARVVAYLWDLEVYGPGRTVTSELD
ncbi:MAG: hypothetical protein JXA83_10250 [Acidimicrobiales bacterium]|nr:hypothetical protein [Acidimicrobiales bacterium]